MGTKKYSREMIDYLREIVPGRYQKEITTLFNEKFGTTLTNKQIKAIRGNHKIRSGVSRRDPRTIRRLLSEEQHEYLLTIVKGRLNREVAAMMNEKFGLSLTEQQINSYKANHDLRSGLDTSFSKGHVPINKGTKGMFNVGGNSGSFKKGQRPQNYKPIGYERVDKSYGYVLVKVQDEGPWNERWRLKHTLVWEAANGPVPDGHMLIFLDGDKTNCSLENLKMITQAENARLNQNHWRSSDPAATEVGVTMAKIKNRIGEHQKKMKNR